MKIDMDNIIARVIETIMRVIGMIPRRISISMGNALGHLLFLLDKRHRNITLDNLTHAYGHEKTPKEIRRMAIQIFKNLGQIPFEMGWSLVLRPERFRDYFRIEGMPHLRAAHARGKGVFLLTAHMGNWELSPVIHELMELPVSVIYRPLDFQPLQHYFMKTRSRSGARLISIYDARQAIPDCLAKGDILLMLMDQNVDPRQGVFVDFFGRPACANKGLAKLALDTGTPVVPGFVVRENKGYRVFFLPEVPLIRTGDLRKDLEENTQRYNRIIEKVVRLYPEQWFWVHQRWKARPSSPWPRQ